MKKFLAILLSVLMVVLTVNPISNIKASAQKTTINISVVTKNSQNDLLVTLNNNFDGIKHYTTLDAALSNASANGTKGIFVLADNYPDQTLTITEAQSEKINSLGIRLYVEYPSNNNTLGITGYGETRTMGYERAVVRNADAMGMAKNSILYVHGAKYKSKASNSNTWLANATVAGYDTADFGLNDCTPYSMLETNAAGNVLIASTKLSQFISARYAPYERWQKLWLAVISWVSQTNVSSIEWTPLVTANYGKTEALSSNAYKTAVDLNTKWYINNMISSSGGIYQCYLSGNNFDAFGDQTLNSGIRADCTAESIGAIALAGELLGNQSYKDLAYSQMKWMLNESAMANGDRANTSSSQYGLFSWYNSDAQLKSYYGDDNAKAIIGLMLAASALDTDEFDRRILEAIIANFRTTGQNGFRGSMLSGDDLDKNGWEAYFNSNTTSYSSHFESMLWACYLWAYEQTGYEPLYTRSETALTMMVAAYVRTMDETDQYFTNDEWKWTNSLQADRAKLILPLSWLVRVSPTEEHIKWLDLIVSDMMSYQDASTGAIRDVIGEEWQGTGSCGAFTKNSEYGTHESPVIQENGDPCTDSLYTSNFAVISLNEAYAAVKAAGNQTLASKYQKYAKSATDYLVKIQQVSTDSKYNGVWCRGFDYQKWETYGSDGDAGWGIWCTESGWTQSFISSAISLQSMGTNIWDYTSSSTAGKHFESVKSTMLNYQNATPDYQPDLTQHINVINTVIGGASSTTPSGSTPSESTPDSTSSDDISSVVTDSDGNTYEEIIVEEIIVEDGKNNNNRLWLWISIAAAAVAVIAATLIFCYIKFWRKKTLPQPTESSVSEAENPEAGDLTETNLNE